jgi:hypothetical protein
VWGALTLSQVLYGLVLLTTPQAAAPTEPLPLWIPAIGSGLVSLSLFATRLSYLKLQALFAGSPPLQATQRAFVFYIVCWAMNESVAIFGFVNAFISTHQFSDFLPYLAASVALNIVMFPKLDLHLREAEARQALQQG